MQKMVCPGTRLGKASDFRAGPGTYERGMYIFASVVGPREEQAAEDGKKPFLIVSLQCRQYSMRFAFGMLGGCGRKDWGLGGDF